MNRIQWLISLTIGLTANLLASSAFAQKMSTACARVHSNSQIRFFEELDSEANRKAYHRFMDQNNEQKLPPGFDRRKSMDIATMGILGSIYDFKWDPMQKKFVKQINLANIEQAKQRTTELLSRHPGKASPELLEMLQKSVHVEELTDSSVILTAKLVSKELLEGFPQALLHRYQRVGSAVVDFVYRTSGAEPVEPLTGMTMLDETVQVIKNQRGFGFHLVFDKAVWEKELQLLSARLDSYNQTQDPTQRKSIIDQVNQPNDPFLPTTGVVTTEFVVPNSVPVELKRYFQNPDEDPLNFVQPQAKNEFLIRQQMLYHVIEGLPEGTTLEIRAHSVALMRNYVRLLGFKFIEKTDDKFYPGAEVNVLRGQREEVLKKIKATIDKIAEGV